MVTFSGVSVAAQNSFFMIASELNTNCVCTQNLITNSFSYQGITIGAIKHSVVRPKRKSLSLNLEKGGKGINTKLN